MGDIFINLKRTFNSGNILAKLIYINVGLFVIIRLTSVILMLFNLSGFPFLQYLQVPSSPELLLYRPWTIITYMFTHFDFLHILFNMLWLYWFGGLFLTFFSERQLGGLYLLGGIAGAVLFLVAYNIFPYFRTVAAYSYLMGASASVMAIVFAVSFYRKDLEIGLFLIGRIKLIYLALFTFVIDLLAITSTNAIVGNTVPKRFKSTTFLKASTSKSRIVLSGAIVAPDIFPPAAFSNTSMRP